MVVQHNLQAMNANRMLGITQGTVANATEKLSSGYRINRAADDAAGLSISEKMRKQIRGLDQASTNAEDGISCVQTAEGALAEVQDMLQRMNELCVQAANGTNSTTDRKYIQDEIDQLISEIDRVSETTKFNEIYLLKGDKTAGTTKSFIASYAVTYIKNDVSNAIGDATEHKVKYTGNNNIYFISKDIKTIGTANSLAANKIGYDTDITKYMVKSAAAGNTANATLSTSYVAFVNVELNSAVAKANPAQGAPDNGLGGLNSKTIDLAYDTTSSIVKASRNLYIYDTQTGNIRRVDRGCDMMQYIKDDQTMKDQYRLVDILYDPNAAAKTADRVKDTLYAGKQQNFAWTDKMVQRQQDQKVLYDADGNEVSGIKLSSYLDEHGQYKGGLYTTAQARATDEVFGSDTSAEYKAIKDILKHDAALIGDYISISSTDVSEPLSFELHVGADSDKTNKINTEITSISAAGLGVDKLASTKVGIIDKNGMNATNAIDIISDAIQKVSTQRSALGAIQNRLDHTIKNLDNIVENTQAAESQIRDTDMAEEMVRYSNNNVLQQAGQSMLAQANQANQGILSLLQ